MQILTISPWGLTTPGSPCVVLDDPDFGQRLWLLYTDDYEQLFPFGPDWMNVAWMDKKKWPLGYQRIDHLGPEPGYLVVLDLIHPKTKLTFAGDIDGPNSEKLCEIFIPEPKRRVGELWALDPGGELNAGSWSLSLDLSDQITFRPVALANR